MISDDDEDGERSGSKEEAELGRGGIGEVSRVRDGIKEEKGRRVGGVEGLSETEHDVFRGIIVLLFDGKGVFKAKVSQQLAPFLGRSEGPDLTGIVVRRDTSDDVEDLMGNVEKGDEIRTGIVFSEDENASRSQHPPDDLEELLELGGLFKVVKAHVATDKVDGSRGDRDIMDGVIVEADKERSREESASFEEDVFPRVLVVQDKRRSSDRDVLFEGGNSETRVTNGNVVVDLVFIVEGLDDVGCLSGDLVSLSTELVEEVDHLDRTRRPSSLELTEDELVVAFRGQETKGVRKTRQEHRFVAKVENSVDELFELVPE